ncbi:VasL domain-containing protein [Pantoea sp. JK]|uniref:VasL domain-containing protein n=1 Tax=Pantoea sp. JK TaxID=2871703 RepID=UPI002238527C|nr:VasL domain-containing protein [Pantoea sp. JK]MCW6030443.1 type VI secretion system ImpA family N-terminal domain-containing protein [Pantoea sp. JK]
MIGEALRFNSIPPRQNTAFLLLSSEMATLARQPNTQADWPALERLCQRVFRTQGYDLQTGVWFCLISLRLHGWQGVAEGLTMLSTALSVESPQPSDPSLQREILTWAASHLVTPIYTLAPGNAGSDDLARAAASLQVLSRMAKIREVRGHEVLDNLCYFLEVRARSPHSIVLDWDQAQPAQVVCKTPALKPVLNEEKTTDQQRPMIASPPKSTQRPGWHWLVLSTLGGAAVTLLVCAGAWLMLRPAVMPSQLAPFMLLHQLDEALVKAKSSQHKPSEKQWREIEVQLQQLAQRPVTWLLAEGNQLVRHFNQLQPENPIAQNWYNLLTQETQHSNIVQNWQDIHQRLDALDKRLIDSEKKQRNHLTISELKTEIYALRSDLQRMGIPISVLMHELDSPALSEKKQVELRSIIQERFDNLAKNFISK